MAEMEQNEKIAFWSGVVAVFAIPVVVFVISVPLLLLEGFYFSTLWNWWISPTFGLTKLSLVNAIGISLVINYFRSKTSIKDKKEYWKQLLNTLWTDTLILLTAWLLLFFK